MNERTKSAVITLAVGLGLNISLGVAKLVTGLMSGSTSVTSDALNNLSDAAVSVVTIAAMFLAARAADHDHPFGHGRYEYIATFILGAVITAVGVEVFIGGVRRAVEPEAYEFGIAVWLTLGLSIAVKLFMAVFYIVRGKLTGSDTIKAAAVDSASDAAVTSVVLACAFIEKYSGALIDGYVSIAVSAVILVFAVRILKSTIGRLLGARPDPALYDGVMGILTASPAVISVHDLVINDYGERNKLAEADAVFPADMSFIDVHAVCDGLEREVLEKTGVKLCLHADPHIEDGRLNELGEKIEALAASFGAGVHDISIDDERRCVTLDIALGDKSPRDETVAQVQALIRSQLDYDAEIGVDYI